MDAINRLDTPAPASKGNLANPQPSDSPIGPVIIVESRKSQAIFNTLLALPVV
jgi:hypothetical protein